MNLIIYTNLGSFISLHPYDADSFLDDNVNAAKIANIVWHNC